MIFTLFFIAWLLIGALEIFPLVSRELQYLQVNSIWQRLTIFFMTLAMIVTWPVWVFPRKSG
jgi:hypothetical protein